MGFLDLTHPKIKYDMKFDRLTSILQHLDHDVVEVFVEIGERVRDGEFPEWVLDDYGLEPDFFFEAVALAEMTESQIRERFHDCA
jgi:hypothetical protein